MKLETEFSKAEILKEVDALKKQIDDMRPLPADVEGKIMQKLRLDWNYHSNAIEGNKLSFGETVAFLMEGITAKGKPLKDHLDIRGHNEAINFLLSIVKDTRPISEADIRALHKMILVEPYDVKAQTTDGLPTTKRVTLGEYKILPNHVQTATGETHYYATPEETPAKMQELMEWYAEVSSHSEIHPVVLAALFHHKFVSIHPFDDGNGRLSRILMNLILMQKGYPPVVIKMDDRQNYYALLSRADNGDGWPFIEYISERLVSSLQLYLKAANGGDIDEDEDIDKEIALLKMQMNGGVVAKEKKSKKTVADVFFESILPLSIKVISKIKKLEDAFFNNYRWFKFYYVENKNDFDEQEIEDIGEEYSDRYTRFFSSDKVETINSIQISLTFKEYKDPENNFTIPINVTINFEDFYYKIILTDDLIISKLYHERLSAIDQSKIIKSLIEGFKKQLNENLKSPE